MITGLSLQVGMQIRVMMETECIFFFFLAEPAACGHSQARGSNWN